MSISLIYKITENVRLEHIIKTPLRNLPQYSRCIKVSVNQWTACHSNTTKPMHDSLYIPYLACWDSVSDTHRTRTQHSRVPAARVRQHVTSAASRSAYDPTSCVYPHVIHSRISTPNPSINLQHSTNLCRQNGILS